MSRDNRWMREHGTLHIPRRPSQQTMISRNDGLRATRRTSHCARSRFVSRENSLERLFARRIEVRPFTDSADHAPGNLRRPGRDRDRKRAAVQRTAGAQRRIARSVGTSDSNV